MPSTLQDFGRTSERYGDIPFYYSFPVKFWFGQSMLVPEDVLTWCRENCEGYYKVICYTHEDSKKKGKDFVEKIMYVDKIYLEKIEDAAIIKLAFDVREQQVKRPKLRVEKRERIPKEERALKPTSPEGIAAATRRHAQKHATKTGRPKPAAKKTAKKK